RRTGRGLGLHPQRGDRRGPRGLQPSRLIGDSVIACARTSSPPVREARSAVKHTTSGNGRGDTSDNACMNKTRTGSFAAALALTAVTVAATPAHAAPAVETAAPAVESATVHYATTGTGSSATGSLENEFVQAGLILAAGLGVS